MGSVVVACVVAAIAAAGCGGRSGRGQCTLPGYTPRVVDQPANFAKVRPYRSYYAITDVSPPAHLYTVWYHDIEPTVVKVRVTEDANGALLVSEAGGWWGGMGVPPREAPPAPPPEVERFTRAVREAMVGCGDGELLVAYQGRHREVRVTELIGHGTGVGWFATTTLQTDEALTRVEGTGEQMSGFGLFEVPRSARWVAYTPPPGANGARLLMVKPPADLTAALLAAARDLDAGTPGPAFETLVPADDTSLLPAGFAQDLRVEITIYGRTKDFEQQQGGMYHVAFPLADAVFGGSATGRTTIQIGRRAFVLAATLTADPRAQAAEQTKADFAGTLAITVDGGPQHVFQREYRASGPIELDGNRVVAPTGFVLPGTSSSDPEYERLHATLPGDEQFTSIDVYVGGGVFSDPRE